MYHAILVKQSQWKCIFPEGVPMDEMNNTVRFTVLAGRVIEV
ncbi:hypothetical protein [Corynebacterium sp. HMSC29G08]|nr:hypothetical protein [Corynebacterium sp. HMSC29G08]